MSDGKNTDLLNKPCPRCGSFATQQLHGNPLFMECGDCNSVYDRFPQDPSAIPAQVLIDAGNTPEAKAAVRHDHPGPFAREFNPDYWKDKWRTERKKRVNLEIESSMVGNPVTREEALHFFRRLGPQLRENPEAIGDLFTNKEDEPDDWALAVRYGETCQRVETLEREVTRLKRHEADLRRIVLEHSHDDCDEDFKKIVDKAASRLMAEDTLREQNAL